MQYFLCAAVMLVLTICFYFLTQKQVLSKGKVNRGHTATLLSTHVDRSKQVKITALVIIAIIFFFYFITRLVGTVDGRGVGGIDALVYRNRFSGATGNIIEALRRQDNEVGYALLVYVVRIFTSDFNVFLAVYYTILLVLIYKFLTKIKSTSIMLFCIMVFVTIPIMISMNLMRNILSYFLIANAAIAMMEKKHKKTFIYALLGISCHISAIIFVLAGFIFYILENKKIPFNVAIASLCIAIVAGFVGIVILEQLLKNTKYAMYFNVSNISITSGLLSFVMIFFVWWRYKAMQKDRQSNLGFALIIANVFVVIMQFKLAILYRLLIFSGIGVMLLASGFEKAFRQKKTELEFIAIFIFFALYTLISVISHFKTSISSYGLLPWYSIFGGL